MSTKFLFFALGAFLLVQCSNGHAIDAKTVEATTEDERKLEKAAFEFINTTLSGMFHLIDTTFNASRIAFEPIFSEIASTGDTTKTEIQEKVEQLKKLLDKMSALKDDEESQNDKADLIDDLGKIFSDFKNITNFGQAENLTDFDKKVLNAHESLRTDLEKSFTTYIDLFVNAAETYWNSIPTKNQMEERKFRDAFTQLKNEEDIETKARLLKDLVLVAFEDSSEEKN